MIVVKLNHLNSFLHFNKIYNNHNFQVNHHFYIIFTAHHMITVELDMNYVYYMNSNSIFWIHLCWFQITVHFKL